MTEETWKPIEGSSGYEISSIGRVRSYRRSAEPKIVAQFRKPDKLGKPSYFRVGIRSDDGIQKKHFTHRLVACAFIGRQPTPIHQVAHTDGDSGNNSLSNLRWATPEENQQDRKRHGKDPIGSRHPSAKLTESDIMKIRADGRYFSQIARDYGVTRPMIGYIKNRKNWAHV